MSEVCATITNNAIETFVNDEFGSIRSLIIEMEPWFIGRDIATALGYKNTKDAIQTHVDAEDRRVIQRSEITTLENHLPKSALPVEFVIDDIPNRGLTAINESGLYSLVLSSKLPKAKDFKRWVTSEVLPSIRKKGYYVKPDAKDLDREVPLSREELVMIIQNLVNGANQYMTTFSNNLITAVNKTIDNRLEIFDESNKVALKTNEYLTKSHEDIMNLWKTSKYKTAKLETLLSDLVVKLDNNYTVSSAAHSSSMTNASSMATNTSTEKPEESNINPNLVNSLSAYKTKKWLDDAWDYARIIGQINGKDNVSVLKEVYKILRREGFNLNRLNTEYAKTHPGKSSYISMIADSDVMRPKAEAAFKELYVKYTPNINSVATEKAENPEDKIKSNTVEPKKKIYKSQVLLSTPTEVRALIDIISAKRNCAPHQTAANVYREIEKRTNKNLKELANQYAEKLGYTNCSKAYYISKDKMMMEILKELAA